MTQKYDFESNFAKFCVVEQKKDKKQRAKRQEAKGKKQIALCILLLLLAFCPLIFTFYFL
jgi:hypothetical protein